MFGRGKPKPGLDASPPGQVYVGLRGQVLAVDPASVGLRPSVELPRVYGALLETGYPNGTATLVALADGTTSLYTSGGFGIIGGGAHPQVAAANQKFLRAVEQSFDTMAADDDSNVPATGESVIRALGFGERRAVRAAEADFGNGRHPLSGLFYAAQDVVTQLRLIDQGRQAGSG